MVEFLISVAAIAVLVVASFWAIGRLEVAIAQFFEGLGG